MIYVCPLSRLHETVEQSGARHIVTLINADTPVERPPQVPADNHLFVGVNDIIEPMDGMTAPAETHVGEVIEFVRGWDRSAPIVIHCWAGISRSTAAAYLTACLFAPHRDEMALARRLRAASPSATPNRRIVDIADRLLGRDGRMSDAIARIGRGRAAFEGDVFALSIDE